ncbi:MAG TPA: NAD-dependent epimerase/dehydratase family protein, partial [Acidimicrobiales bacterium]|nr:NAD-dependent epimerase/dehydratase family protein [Acidimicrobiales bacterium]
MKVFVTGGTGVVGTRAIPALVAAGHEVTAVARSADKAALVRELGGRPVEADLFDADAVKDAVAGHDAIANLATSIPPLSRASRPKAWEANERIRRVASRLLVDAALATGATHVVQESIAFPYVDNGDRWIDEDHPVDHALGPFGGAGVAEGETARFTEAGGTGVVLRFAQFYAAEATHTVAFNRAVRWFRLNPFFGDPDAYTSFVHADDAGSAVAAALRAPAGIYNVVDDEPMTRAEAGQVVAAANGRRRAYA